LPSPARNPLLRFHQAVAETLIALDVPDASEARRADAIEFVLGQIAALPLHTATGVRAAALTLMPGFERRDAAGRIAAIHKWERSKLPSTRLYLRLLRSLVLFAAYDTTWTLR